MTGGRHVRRLRITAPDPGLVNRGRILIEDALRTASLPEGDGGRVYVVRRLDLGVIDPARAPAVVAQAIERRFAALRGAAVHADAAGAAAASAVYFHDAVEPFTLLVRRLIAGPPPPPDAWFWPLAVSGYRPHAQRADALRAAIAGALATPARGAAVVELCAALGDAEIDPLCEALRETDGAALLAGLPGAGRPAALAVVPAAGDALPPSWRRLLLRWLRRWGAGDPRTVWLAATAIGAVTPARAADPALRRRAAGLIAGLLAAAAQTDDDDDRGGDGGVIAAAGAPPAAGTSQRVPAPRRLDAGSDNGSGDGASSRLARAEPDGDGDGGPAPVARARDRSPAGGPADAAASDAGAAWRARADRVAPLTARPDQQAGADHPPATARSAGAATPARSATVAGAADVPPDSDAAIPERRSGRRRASWEGTPLPTAAGGLLFLIHPLARLGFPAWLDHHGDEAGDDTGAGVALGPRLLRHVARHVGVPDDDPSLLPFQPPPAEDEPLLTRPQRRAIDRWRVELTRWTRRRARLPLRAVVRRSARIVATRTHVDVLFDARDADIRVRAAGLDIDPGWVPWLGKVVQFHYTQHTQHMIDGSRQAPMRGARRP